MSSQIRIVRVVLCSVLLLVAACAVIQSVRGEPGLSDKALLSSQCVLCNNRPKSVVARICNNCENKSGSQCVLCNNRPKSVAARICNNCENK